MKKRMRHHYYLPRAKRRYVRGRLTEDASGAEIGAILRLIYNRVRWRPLQFHCPGYFPLSYHWEALRSAVTTE